MLLKQHVLITCQITYVILMYIDCKKFLSTFELILDSNSYSSNKIEYNKLGQGLS
jgi:hypothetical protein